MGRDPSEPGKVLRSGCRTQCAEGIPAVMRNERETRIGNESSRRTPGASVSDFLSVPELLGKHLLALIQGHQVDHIRNDLSQESDNRHELLAQYRLHGSSVTKQ